MPFGDRNEPLSLSLLDRLLADDSDTQPGQSLKALKHGVERDLHNLLNTRWRCESWPPDLKQLETSLVNYGIPDFTGLQFTSAENRESLRATIEDVIRRFEPRFVEVTVSLESDDPDPLDQTLKLRIDALLQATPRPEPIVFETTVETMTGDIDIRDAHR